MPITDTPGAVLIHMTGPTVDEDGDASIRRWFTLIDGTLIEYTDIHPAGGDPTRIVVARGAAAADRLDAVTA